MADKTLAKGFYFDRPREGAPDFVKGRMSVKVEDAIAFLNEHKNEAGYVNYDLLQSKDGTKLYFTLNDWKPEEKKDEAIDPSSVPF